MEGLKGENWEEKNFDSRENKNPMEDLAREFVFEKENKFSISDLAQEEGRGAIHGPGSRMVKNEEKLCNYKKSWQKKLLKEKPEKIPECFCDVKKKYCDNFALALIEGAKNDLPPSRQKAKNRVILDEGTGIIAFDASKKAEISFTELEKGMMREITVNRILNAILDLKAEIASSDIDIKNKIDIVAYFEKTSGMNKIILAVQVKGDYGNENGEAVEEVFAGAKDTKKKEFFYGSENFEKKLKAKDSEAKVIKIWINVSDDDITSEGAGYKNELKADIEYELKKILAKYQS